MRRNRLLMASVIAGSAAVFSHLYRGSTGIDFAEHRNFEHSLRQLRDITASFDLDILKSRFQLLGDYDGLSQKLDEASEVLAEQCVCPVFVDAESRAAIGQSLVEIETTLAEERQLAEEFKTQNSVMRNSLAYFPVAGAQLERNSGDGPTDRGLRADITELMHTLLVFSLGDDEETGAGIQRLMASVRRIIDMEPTHHDAPLVANLLAHANVLHRRKPILEDLTRRLMTMPTGDRITATSRLYENAFATATATAHSYRLALFGCSILLLAGISWSLLALRSANHLLEDRVHERTGQLHNKNAALEKTMDALGVSEHRFRTLSTCSPVGIFQTDDTGRCTYANPRCESLLGLTTEQIAAGVWLQRLHAEDATRVTTSWQQAMNARAEFSSEHRFMLSNGESRWVHARSSPITEEDGIAGHVGMIVDITDRKRAEEQRETMEVQLQEAQKLESVGRLAAGVAHEINTPTQFVGDNIRFLRDAFADLDKLIAGSKDLVAALDDEQRTVAAKAIGELHGNVDFGYLSVECPLAISQSLDGVDRVAKIVHAMKDFAHADQAEKAVVDVNRAIRSAITVCRNEWKYCADVSEQLDECAPTVWGYAQDLGQVVLNLVVNAAHAVTERPRGAEEKGRIVVRSNVVGDTVVVEIEDNGAGIPETVKPRIFEQFFTTKPVGKGTGQGLALCHRVVQQKHGGQITFESQSGKGTTFRITLPRR